MNEASQKFVQWVTTTWRREQGLPPPPDRFNPGDKVVVHERELTAEEAGRLGPLMRAAIAFRREHGEKLPADRHGEFLAYGTARGGKHLVFVEFEDGVTVTLEDNLEHEP